MSWKRNRSQKQGGYVILGEKFEVLCIARAMEKTPCWWNPKVTNCKVLDMPNERSNVTKRCRWEKVGF